MKFSLEIAVLFLLIAHSELSNGPLDAVSSMKDGDSSMKDGSSSMKDGGSSMKDGGSSMTDGSSSMKDGGSSMKDGGSSMKDGGSSMKDGGSSMKDGGSSMKDGGSSMKDGGSSMKDGEVVAAHFNASASKPSDEEEINGGRPGDLIHAMDLFEADVVLTLKQKVMLEKQRRKHDIHKRAVITDLTEKWKNRVVPYTIASSLVRHRAVILRSMESIQSKTCIRFVPKTSETDYIYIFRGEGCYSYVGRIGGRQALSIGDSCEVEGIIIHELLHALGRWHEHNRPDRDQYVAIQTRNIRKRYRDQFEKLPSSDANTDGVSYDYGSIMHYTAFAFSRNGDATIVPRDRRVSSSDLGQREELSGKDVQHIQNLYCDQSTSSWSQWSQWSSCSVSCGSGQQSRSRSCSGGSCPGSSTQTRQCQLASCPGQWSGWGQWSTCSATCGNGQQTRTRTCRTSSNCLGSNTETRTCSLAQCSGLWSSWGQWSSCSVTCGGGGRQTRSRTCRNGNCAGFSSEFRSCGTLQCGSTSWRSWSSWSTCTPECGTLRRRWRSRTCPRGQLCTGQFIQFETCSSKACGTGYSAWTPWINIFCTWNCQSGYRYRYRRCIDPSQGCTPFRYQYDYRQCTCLNRESFHEAIATNTDSNIRVNATTANQNYLEHTASDADTPAAQGATSGGIGPRLIGILLLGCALLPVTLIY